MGFIDTNTMDLIGLVYAIAGIVLVIPTCFVFRHYFRFFDHVQFLYLFYVALASSTKIFSGYLQVAWASIKQNFYVFCKSGDLVCTLGFQLSYTSCLVVAILLIFIIIRIVACKRPEAKFEPVYRFLKGLIRWTYVPLVYYSLFFMITSIKGIDNYLIESCVVFAVCAVFPIFQLIAYKCIQTENQHIWPKWIEFINYLRLLFIASLIAIGIAMDNKIPYYIVYGIIVIYAIIYGIKNKFSYKVVGRVFFVLGECCTVCIFSFFLFKQSYLMDYHLDLFLVSVILLLDLIYMIMEIVFYCKNGIPKDTDSERINPEDSEADRKVQKRNSYAVDLEDLDENEFSNKKKYRDSSREELNQSRGSGNLNSSKIAKTRRKR